MSATRNVLALTTGLLLFTLACKKPVEDQQVPQPLGDEATSAVSGADTEAIPAEALAKAVEQAREQARDVADPNADPRKFVEEFQSELRPQIEEEIGEDLPPLPIDFRKSAMPMYSNYTAMIEANYGTDTYRGDKKKGALRREAVALPLRDSICTAVVIARNAIATARHCAQSKPERILLGATVASGEPLEIDPKGFVLLKAPGGKPLDMAILVRKNPIKDLKDADLPVFASRDMIDKAQELLVVGYGGAKANSSESGTKRLGRIPVLSADCSGANVATDHKCVPGLEIVAGNRAMFDRVSCPAANAPNPVQGACGGDSGGPVYVEKDNKLYLAAIVRSILPNQCGCADATNLYVRFDKQVGVIKQVSGIDFHPAAFTEIESQ